MIKRRLSIHGKKTKKNSTHGREALRAEAATMASSSSNNINGRDGEIEWEMKPCGMLVQKRTHSTEDNPAPCIRVRVVYGDLRYEISVSSQATFGELKRQLTEECGLQHWEQRLMYRGKERDDKEFLDNSGVKEKSKIVVVEDPCSREKRFIEMRRNNKIQRSHRAISDLSAELDTFADQISQIEKSISNRIKVPEIQITTLIEMLMRQAVKLDSISAEGEVVALKNLQGKRVQKCVETLDALKISNTKVVKPVVVTTKWETFDHHPPLTHAATTQWNLLD